jgi:peptidoglycan hydrolase-like protein with peptidoglycan-binding domain
MIFKFAVFALSPMLLLAVPKPPSHTAKKVAVKATASRSHKGRRRYAGARRKAGPSYQARPTDERYKEIQQALADKGYYKGQVDGQWNADSADSLKRFQTDHQLTNDGKINSLSLIQLGLGPKRDGIPTVPLAAPAEPQPIPAGARPGENPQQASTGSQ